MVRATPLAAGPAVHSAYVHLSVSPCSSIRPERAAAASAGRGCSRVQCAPRCAARETSWGGAGSWVRARSGVSGGPAPRAALLPGLSFPARSARGQGWLCGVGWCPGPRCPHPAPGDGWHPWLRFLCATPHPEFPASGIRGGRPRAGRAGALFRVLGDCWLAGRLTGAGGLSLPPCRAGVPRGGRIQTCHPLSQEGSWAVEPEGAAPRAHPSARRRRRRRV